MSRKEINFPEVQRQRNVRRRYIRIAIAFSCLFMVALGAAWVIFWSPLFRLQPFENFEIIGNEKITDEDIIVLLKTTFGKWSLWRRVFGFRNILGWPDVNDRDVKLMPKLSRFEVRKNYILRILRVEVHERESYGIWCRHGMSGVDDTREFEELCYWFDKEGVLFERAVSAEGNLIFIVHDYSGAGVGLSSRILPPQFIPNIFSVLHVLRESGVSIKEVRIQDINLQEVAALTHSGPELYFSLRFPASTTLPVINELSSLEEFPKLKYIDFRVENRVYYE